MCNPAAHPRRRIRRLLLPIFCCAGLLVPLRHLPAAHADVTSAYMANYSSCIASGGCLVGDLPPQTAFPSGVSTVCLVVLGSFQSSDSLTATIFDSQGHVDWSSGPTTQQSLIGSGGGSLVSGIIFASPDGLTCSQPSQAITGAWPDGAYHTTVNFNNAIVQTINWTVGTVPPTSTQPPATNTPVPPTSTPVPPSATPKPATPTATAKPASPTSTSIPAGVTPATPSVTPGTTAPSPSATPGGEGSKPGGTGKPHGALYTGKGFQVTLPKGWKGALNKSGASTFISADHAVILLIHVYKTTATPDAGTQRQVIQADVAGFEKNTRIAYGPYGLGALKGTAGTTHLHDGSVLQVMVIADRRHVVVLFVLTAPHAPHQDAQAGAAILHSLHLTS